MKFDRTLFFAFLACLLVASLPSYAIGQTPGFLGYILGLAVAFFSFAALTGIVWLMGVADKPSQTPLFFAVLVVAAFLIKLPLYAYTSQIASGLNEPGPGCFVVAIVLVYSAAISLLALSSRDDQ